MKNKNLIILLLCLTMINIPLVGIYINRMILLTEGEIPILLLSGLIAELVCIHGIIYYSESK